MKVICVPKDIEAMARLDTDGTRDGDVVEYQLGEKEFECLWRVGYIDVLNTDLNLAIDEFEDEKIELEYLSEAVRISKHYMKTFPETVACLTEVVELMGVAQRNRTALFLFF
jgi:hypothetical protein